MFSKKSLVRALVLSVLIVFWSLMIGIVQLYNSNETGGEVQAAESKTFSTTFKAAEDLVKQEMGIKVSAECNYLTGHESLPLFCLKPWGLVFVAGKRVGVYYSLDKVLGFESRQDEDLALIYVSRQAIKVECSLENKSDCQNVFAFTFWSADLVSSR